jgi:hypothetical protein
MQVAQLGEDDFYILAEVLASRSPHNFMAFHKKQGTPQLECL